MKKLHLSAVIGAAAVALTALPAHAAISCAVAGQYDGSYEGDDHGIVRVVVEPDGTLTGKAQSQVNGAAMAVGGVVASDGTLGTDGAVESGSRFEGHFAGNLAGGTWGKVVMIDGSQRILGGTWRIQKTTPVNGCQ